MTTRFSIIVAVYNRPEELSDLLQSLTSQTFKDFELVIVEDGSDVTSQEVVETFRKTLSIQYFAKENSGPAGARNYGCERAHGQFFVFVDSDCTCPPHYLATIDETLRRENLSAFGGPDREDDGFSPVQKAISFSMTSLFTTGGIRGGKTRVGGQYHPRSFNMGISREVFEMTGGFGSLRFGEDVEFSIRIIEGGFKTGLIEDAFVFHKRRTDFVKFFRQVHNSGIARINIFKRHPSTLKLTHFFPSVFTLACFAPFLLIPFSEILSTITGVGLVCYLLLIFASAYQRFNDGELALLSVIASCVQLVGYGTGFLRGVWRRLLLRQDEFTAFQKTFYK